MGYNPAMNIEQEIEGLVRKIVECPDDVAEFAIHFMEEYDLSLAAERGLHGVDLMLDKDAALAERMLNERISAARIELRDRLKNLLAWQEKRAACPLPTSDE